MDYMDDEDAFEGPDAYIDEEDDYDVEYDVAEDDPDITGEAEDDDEGLNRQRQSIVDMLNNTFVSVMPDSQNIDSTSRNSAILTSSLTIDQVRLLLAAAQSHGLRTSFGVADDNYQEEDDPDYVPPDDAEDEDYNSAQYTLSPFGRRPQTGGKAWFKPATEPQEAGVRLIHGGEFGRLNAKKSRNIWRMLKERESRIPRHGQGLHKEDFARELVPNTDGTVVASYGSNAYSGQYSADSSFYYTCCQDWRLHVYDTEAPLNSFSRENERQRRRLIDDDDHETTMKTLKTVRAVPGSWTITDSHLSPDNERLIYSSITSTVYMTKTFEPSAPQIPLKFGSSGGGRRRTWDSDADDFGIYSCRFSADGNEVIAGGNGSNSGELRVYDLLAERRTITINAHGNDVNSCCWADTSGNILISASDDTFVKVWDRRSIGSTQKPSGVLVGHTEGITYVSAKGDGRYIISNGKDQAIRLWDLRKMHSNTEFGKIGPKSYGHRGFDYRYGSYPKPTHKCHPRDCSVMTYRGHQVFRTLIRCHFSPIETTGANYIYTGSSDGRIHIYSLDGRIVQILDRGTTLPIHFDPSDRVPSEKLNRAPVCVRDVSWHSQEPVIMSVGWESGYGRSSVARHEWKGIGKFNDGMGKLEDYVERSNSERRYQTRSATQFSRMPGSFNEETED